MVCVTCVWSVIFDTNIMHPIKFSQDLLEMHVFLKGCSHDRIATAILIITNNGLHGLCLCYNPIIYTLKVNPVQPICCDKMITIAIASCE